MTLLFSVDEYFEAAFEPGGDVGPEEFEVFVEGRLRGDGETYRVGAVLRIQGDVGVDAFEGPERREERPLAVDVGRIEPDGGVVRKNFKDTAAVFRGGVRKEGGDDVGLLYRLFGGLGVRVEYADILDFVAPEGEAEGLAGGVGEDVDEGAANRELAGGAYEVDSFEAGGAEGFDDFVEAGGLAFFDGEDGAFHPRSGRYLLFQGVGIGYDEQQFAFVGEYLFEGGGALDAEGAFVVAALYPFSRFWEMEDDVAFGEVVKVATAVFGAFAVGQDDELQTLSGYLGGHKPTGG